MLDVSIVELLEATGKTINPHYPPVYDQSTASASVTLHLDQIRIVGTYGGNASQVTYSITDTPIPEPATTVLVISALALGVSIRRVAMAKWWDGTPN